MTPETVLTSLSRTTPRLLALVFIVLLLLFVGTGFLTRAYHREESERADHQFEVAESLVAETHYEEAIDHYVAALLLSRDNVRYKQALALALSDAGRTGEAESYLMEVARSEPYNGIVNLTLARISAERGLVEDASQYYQSAVYGRWDEDPIGNRIRVHFEYIEWLERQGEDVLVKAELLRLLDEAPDDPAAKSRVGHMFLQVNAPEEARDIFNGLLDQDGGNCDAQAGLGDAEFDLADYATAQLAYSRAVRCNPEDLESRTQLNLSTEVLDLDPTRRGLDIRSRVVRSRSLVERALGRLDTCMSVGPQFLPEEYREAVREAREIVEQHSQSLRDETVESNIALAEFIHEGEITVCGTGAVPDQALELVLRILAE